MTTATLMQLVAERARQHPDALALLAPGRTPLTYAALVHEVGRTVSSFAAAGFGRGSRIGLALPNGPEIAVVLLAATDCAACAPLNPAMDAATSGRLLEAMRIDALVVPAGSDSPARQVATTLGVPVIELGFSPADPAGTLALAPLAARPKVAAETPQLGDTVFLMHTSGTTARPKIVPWSFRKIVASARLRAELLPITRADRALLLAPMFMASGIRRNLFPVLGAGGSVVCAPGFDADSFVDWLREFQPTFYTGSPTLHRAVLDLLARRSAILPRSLRFVMTASAPLAAEAQARLERALGVPVIQAYASSEAGNVAQEPLPPAERRPGSVGLPAGCDVAILGDAGALLPPGEAGEILVRGPEVFEGYDDDPEASRAAFFDGWYRTGDLGHLDRDGYLFVSGRIKELVNRGGDKVSPQEVDAALGSHPDVVEAATFAVRHPTLGEDVVAVVVLRAPGCIAADELRDYAFGALASYKVPSRIVVVEQLPKTALGKVRRRELADMVASAPGTGFVRPSGPNEALVARIFGEVLGIDAVGADDNFFELGGDSLRATQVVVRVNAALGLDLPPVTLFQRPTVAGFAAKLAAAAGPGPRREPSPIPRQVREQACPQPTGGEGHA